MGEDMGDELDEAMDEIGDPGSMGDEPTPKPYDAADDEL